MRTKNYRKLWADLTRILAIFMVVMLHSIAPIFYQDFHLAYSISFNTINFLCSIFRVAVPLFILLSGALVLKDNVPIETLWRRIARLLIPLIFWSIIYKYWICFNSGKISNIFYALIDSFNGPVMYHLGFVYYMIGIYLLLPILALIVNEMIKNIKFAYYLLVLLFIVNSLIIYCPLKIVYLFHINNFLSFSSYAVLGVYLTRTNAVSKISNNYCLILFFGGSICTFIITWILNKNSSIPRETAYEYLTPNVVIASIGIFLLLQKIKIPMQCARLLEHLSESSFIIYFIHILVIEKLKVFMLQSFSINFVTYKVIGSLFLGITAYVVSLFISILIRCIPYSKKLVG